MTIPGARAPDPRAAPRTEVDQATLESLESLVADCTDVSRRLAEVPRHPVVPIPSRAVALVAGLDDYGD